MESVKTMVGALKFELMLQFAPLAFVFDNCLCMSRCHKPADVTQMSRTEILTPGGRLRAVYHSCSTPTAAHQLQPQLEMPTTSSLSAEEKAKVKSSVSSSDKIFFATVARIYYAYPQRNKWSYTGIQGGLAFTHDTKHNTVHFKVVDLDGTRGVIWEHELYDNFEFYQDRPYLHSFAGDVKFFPPLLILLPSLTFLFRNA